MTEISSEITPFFAGFLQLNVRIGDIETNLSRAREGLAEIAAANKQISPGIVVLPELWATGFAYEKLPELAGAIPELLEKLQELAAAHRIFIAGSLPEFSDNRYYNTLFITGAEGSAAAYRKQRLFSPMAEETFFSPGPGSSPMQTSLGAVAGLVCYDLRFPELLREQAAPGTNLLVVPAHWPAARVNHWRILVQARAIENQMFVVAANRCGTSDKTVFAGHSMIVGPDGSILLEAGADEECRGTMLDPAMVSGARSRFTTLPDKTPR